MKKKIRIIFWLAGLAVLISFFYAEENWRGRHAWQKFQREWEAKGEKFDFASAVPAPVPDDQNFALAPLVVTSYGSMLTRDGREIPDGQRDPKFINRLKINLDLQRSAPTNANGNWQQGRVSDLLAWQNYYRTSPLTTNIFQVPPQAPAQDVLLALSKHEAVIEELRQAAWLPASRFPLNYNEENPGQILLPHLVALKQCAQVLQMRALAELQGGQNQKAFDDIRLALRLAESIRTEPLLVSQLVRITILNLAIQPLYEGLADQKWTDEQLVLFDSMLAKLDFLADYKLAMHGELGFQDGVIRYLRNHPEQYLNVAGDASDYGHMSVAEFTVATAMHWRLVPEGWFYQNELRCSRAMETYYLPVADVDRQIFIPSLISQVQAVLKKERKNLNAFNILELMLLPNLDKFVKRCAHAQSSVDLARTAIALERYRLAQGKFPEALDVLMPQFMEKLPHDVIGGNPLKYYRTDDGQFVLYSIGWNETDDGGVFVAAENTASGIDSSSSEGDWVWRYPAK